MRKNTIILFIFSLLFSACKTVNYIPKPADMKYYTKGMWIECNLKDNSQTSGELIAVERQKLYVLDLNGALNLINRNSVSNATLKIALTSNSPEKLKVAPLIPLLSISHGLFLVFTLPINLAIVVPTYASNKSGTYIVKYPEATTWEKMSKFARFPQGIPKGVDLKSIKNPVYSSSANSDISAH